MGLYFSKNIKVIVTSSFLVQLLILEAPALLWQVGPPPFPPLLRARHELVEKDRLPVHATATDANRDVPEALDDPVPFRVRHQHLCLHLLAIVVFRAPAVLTRVVAQDLGYSFWNIPSVSHQFKYIGFVYDFFKCSTIYLTLKPKV